MIRKSQNERRISEILEQIRGLCDELHDLSLTTDETTANGGEDTSIMLGSRVMVLSGKGKGKTGVVTGTRGTHYWWIRLDNGDKIYKMEHNLAVLWE